ncbi:ATP-binding cassette domain-containing protein [bacterium]|nr:ATP-binding cassette domain-containing protein [bacterium]
MIKIEKLSKRFGKNIITNKLDLEVAEGEFLAVIGQSGVGKSVLLKQIVGLLKPDSGRVRIDGDEVTKLKGDARRKIFKKCGYVFQFAALLDSLTVFENVGIKMFEDGEPEEKVYPMVLEKLKSVGLSEDSMQKYPAELSGGMKKRVGLARTLMLNPKILIYDEPTTGLDPISVKMIHELMAQTHKERKITTLVISHDIDIFNYATQVAMLYKGKIMHKGPTKDIWHCKDPYIHQFIRGLSDGPIVQPSDEKKK